MSMSSETEILKTNEFQRRRKLRLQQVREQSKDIAKKIRQRAKVEKLRQIVDLDSKKGKEYLQKQEKLVKRLEQLYAQGVQSVGDGHKKASEERLIESSPEKDDLSKLRGKEAVAELRRRKQEKLDKQKKLLDRKLFAREAANEISREKSSSVVNKLIAKSSSSKFTEERDEHVKDDGDIHKVTKTDMATQWDFEEIPNEWEPNVPALSLPKDDKESVKDSNNAVESKSDKSKRHDLFALSSEMPSSLRGGIPNVTEERSSVRPSLTLVSEYLQSRALRLRETDTTGSSKKQSDDLSYIKQTILRSRSSKLEAKGSIDKTISSGVDTNLTKKNSVTMYNHSTRDSRDVPRGDSRLVARDLQTDEDAYSQALKENTEEHSKDKKNQKKLQEMRNKVAMTKQTVEKEYSDTMSFLKTLPTEKCTKHMKNAYMDDRRQRILKVSRQQKLQQEFHKIEKECRKSSENDNNTQPEKTRKKSKSPAKTDLDDDIDCRDLQYSWMPVPESDGNLAIHTIPTTLKESKTGNSVKFSKVDSYHEYRSRHKHTPPTKDTDHKQPSRRVVETVIIHKDNDDTTYCSSISSDTSSVENLNLGDNEKVPDQVMPEADKILIYKILEKKEKEKKKRKLIDNVAKVLKSMDKEKVNKADTNNNKEVKEHDNTERRDYENRIPIDQIDEGVYKVVSEKGDNIASMYFSDKLKTQEGRNIIHTNDEKHGRSCCCDKKMDERQKSAIGANHTCENEDCLRSGCPSNSRTHEHSIRAVNPNVQPSAPTSTASFKTPATDKSQGALPDGGYVKLIDDDGQEAGKFYIGASGFLKDDTYEVIIQLRKKETTKTEQEKENIKPHEHNVIDEETVTSVQDLRKEDIHDNRPLSKSVKEAITHSTASNKENTVDTHKESPRVVSQALPSHMDSLDNNGDKECREIYHNSSGGVSTVSSEEPIPNMEQAKKLVDKGVHTSFQLSYAIPSHFPKTDNFPRPATSTYTQTTMDSPNPRPVFIHMSSSTSTAYMSPPEVVLPNFMRHEHDFKGEKLKMSTRNEHEKCTKKRCKSRTAKSTSSPSLRKSKSINKLIDTPPNTAQSNENSDTFNDELEWVNRKTHSRKCRKCVSKCCSANDIRSQIDNKRNRNAPSNKNNHNLVMRVNPSNASSFKNKMNNYHNKLKVNKPELKPIIKEYVNRLLELNRKGIKAFEVANQECSSVSTPGSSIIEVPRNLNSKKSSLDNKISLEQMKNMLKQKILEECVREQTHRNVNQTLYNRHKSRKTFNKLPKKRSVHRIKSLNISKRLLKVKQQNDTKGLRNIKTNLNTTSHSSVKDIKSNKPTAADVPSKTKPRSKSTPTPRQYFDYELDISDSINCTQKRNKHIGIKFNREENSNQIPSLAHERNNEFSLPFHRASTRSPDFESDVSKLRQQHEAPMNISTQTNQDLDSEINLMKLAEDKLQNMEKIADLTEKCTKRLSNLARVLEEVRRNKSLAYSQISTSDTASDSEHKNMSLNNVKGSVESESDDKTEPISSTVSREQEEKLSHSSEYIPFLANIPKPDEFKYSAIQSVETDNTKCKSIANSNVESMTTKRREKPPPALSRIHLKHGQDVVPHELSTVVEVDSPMSVKLKNQTSTNNKCDVSDMSYKINNGYKGQKDLEISNKLSSTNTPKRGNPDLLQSNANVSKPQNKISSTDSSDDSKMQMMDLKQFNELMLKPFISIQEFAKQCGDVAALDDGSNLDDIPKDDGINEELSSLHSDGSLPDVIAELLKRNIITEPFRFDTVSNVNSTTVSSESMMSVLALSKVRKDKKKSSVVFENKGNQRASETSDSLSVSSNPDLENAFKKLGMGWASSTLKKTKERLALSSSSNTSSSSLSQFKLKCLNEQDVPVLVTDSVLSATKSSSKKQQEKKSDISKNAEQQTSFMNSMTVKEFLTNELAKKITFTNKSRNDTEDEFVSLIETKMPEEMKHMSQSIREERSVESGQNNRARTSTPVQIYKSMTYHSSSSSNMSNGLFSNADDLSSVKVTSNSVRNHSTSDKDDLTIPNCSLKMRKGASDCSKSE